MYECTHTRTYVRVHSFFKTWMSGTKFVDYRGTEVGVLSPLRDENMKIEARILPGGRMEHVCGLRPRGIAERSPSVTAETCSIPSITTSSWGIASYKQ